MNDTAQAKSYKHVMSTPSEREVRVERIFNAPRERVWQP
jgi:hypothetical protein